MSLYLQERPVYHRGLIALSADPVTFGHLDIIRRAAAECAALVVLVAYNERKKGGYLYTLDERVAMVQRAIGHAGIPKVVVVGSQGLLVDVYLQQGCDVLFRGVRNATDLAYEEEQAELNRLILPTLRIKYLDADKNLRLVSSTMVKAFVQLGLDVDKFVPMFVKQSLEEKLLTQFRIGITGRMATGKSTVAKQILKAAGAFGLPARHVNIDALLREVYDEDSPGAQMVRDELARRLGRNVLSIDGSTVDRAALANILFNPKHGDSDDAFVVRGWVTNLTMPHVARKYREALQGAVGLVVVEWAQLVEMDMCAWTNNNVIIVDALPAYRAKFCSARGLSPERVAQMDEIQWSSEDKHRALAERIARAGSGRVLRHVNPPPELLPQAEPEHSWSRVQAPPEIRALFEQLRVLFPGWDELSPISRYMRARDRVDQL